MATPPAEPKKGTPERVVTTPLGLSIRVRMQGPYDMETPLQVVCFFKHKAGGDTLLGAAEELDKELSGAITSLRDRGEFVGEELETLLITPPPGTITPKLLLLVGLGEEESLSLDRMERIGRAAVREAVRLKVTKVAFAPLARDQGSTRLAAGDAAVSIVRAVVLAYDTELRLQRDGLAAKHALTEWVQEAGPKYFDETVAGTERAVKEATEIAGARPKKPLFVARPGGASGNG